MASTGDSRGESKSPKPQSNNASPSQQNSTLDQDKDASLKSDSSSTSAEVAKPLAPPPRPGQQQQQQQGSNTPDYFSGQVAGSLSLEPNPFEQSFGAPETPGGTKLPSVAALTSPSSLLPGTGVTPFPWGGSSLRTGPLSPAMLSGPANDYFGDTHIRGGFPTPNESSMRTGLTPGGSGSMFPAPSPNSQAMFAQLASSGATPGTLDFHRTALSAAAVKQREQQQQQQAQQQGAPAQMAPTSQPQDAPNGVVKPDAAAGAAPKAPSGPFDPHDNDAANGLFMLAQGRNSAQPQNQYAVPPPPPTTQQQQAQAQVPSAATHQSSTSPQMANGNLSSVAGSSVRGVSEVSMASDESVEQQQQQQARPATRGRGKRNSTAGTAANTTATTNGRRKAADDAPAKASANKKSKANNGAASAAPGSVNGTDESRSEDGKHEENGGSKSKMTDEEKRRNFLERNRVAALKCRQRKKQWLANLQSKVEMFSSENDALTAQITQLREEVVNLKTLLLAHKDCPVTQQQGLHGAFMQQPPPMEAFNPQIHPYGMPAAPLANQQVIAGQGVQRRFS
ncbi:hypothetical protein VTK73DRAFT_251 [Phialemonium thermophilum]|uniref:BZIP domain-containing protein n=1 Tax=Phialemonium thermophilum TaxID=223376 RepID=A0ABR3VW82_9PEZI